jgi:hypothetical protein
VAGKDTLARFQIYPISLRDRNSLLTLAGFAAVYRASNDPFITVHLRSEAIELQLFSMLTSIGTPLDVTAEELRIETYFPADEASERVLRELAEREEGGAASSRSSAS